MDPVRYPEEAGPWFYYYVVAYALAGYLIAWQVAEVRAYYNNGITIPLLPMALLQVFRGTPGSQ
jgi:hypothetical protein